LKKLDLYIDLSDQAIKRGAKLIIWPESALPVYLLSGNYDSEVTRIENLSGRKSIFTYRNARY